MRFISVYHLAGYYLSLLLFGAIGLALNLFCLLLGWLPSTERTERFFQRVIHRHFAVFAWWMVFSRLCALRFHGWENLQPGGALIASNHPGLMDVTYLLARLPEAVCIFKPAIARNPVLGAAARRAGYLPGGGGVDLIRQVAEKAASGHRVIVFPEGTRTSPGEIVLPLKPGFVLMAQRARVPIQLVRITWNSNVLAKGQAWWKLPRLPAQIDVTLGPLVTVASDAAPARVAASIEAWFRSPLSMNFATPGAVLPASFLPNLS